MTGKITVKRLTGVMETLLPVLYARVYETRHENAIINDPIAEEWVSQIDYDFSKFDDSVLNHLGVAIRTEILDELTKQFIATNPDALIVNIAAGLDTRFYRMDNDQLTWIELDLPDTIAVRQQLMEETDRHKTLATSALDTQWMDDLKSDTPVLFIVEGLLMYLTEDQIKGMLAEIVERFPKAEFLLEVMGYTQAKHTDRNDAISKTDATFQFGIRDASDMGEWLPESEYIKDISIYDRHVERWLALDIDWGSKTPADFRHSVTRIVHLKVTK